MNEFSDQIEFLRESEMRLDSIFTFRKIDYYFIQKNVI